MKAANCTFTIAALMLMGTSGTALADDCDSILEQGVRNTYSEIRSNDFRTSFSNAYCTKHDSSHGSERGTSVGGSYAGFGVSFGSNNNDTTASRNENCGTGGNALSDQRYLNALERVADPGIVEAWRSCKENSIGVIIEGRMNGSLLTLTYRFRPAGDITQATVRERPHVSGATCKTSLEGGSIVGTAKWTQICNRLGDDPVSVVVNTNFGSALYFLPQPAKLVPPPQYVTNPPKTDLGPMPAKCANWTGPGIPVECLPWFPAGRQGSNQPGPSRR